MNSSLSSAVLNTLFLSFRTTCAQHTGATNMHHSLGHSERCEDGRVPQRRSPVEPGQRIKFSPLQTCWCGTPKTLRPWAGAWFRQFSPPRALGLPCSPFGAQQAWAISPCGRRRSLLRPPCWLDLSACREGGGREEVRNGFLLRPRGAPFLRGRRCVAPLDARVPRFLDSSSVQAFREAALTQPSASQPARSVSLPGRPRAPPHLAPARCSGCRCVSPGSGSCLLGVAALA